MNFKLTRGESIRIYLGENENTAVRIAAENLVKDLQAALGVTAELNDDGEVECQSAEAESKSVDTECQNVETGIQSVEMERQSTEAESKNIKTECQSGEEENKNVKEERQGVETEYKIILKTGITAETPGAAKLADEQGSYHREGFSIAVSDGHMYITGADRRGTIYGIYDFCESIGVSPWYWWADVPVKQKDAFELPDGFLKTDYPSVEYRGIFINDEEELENWVQAHMGEDTIGVKTYEHVFELLLRLKANYIWPAMHVNSFNVKREYGALADRMGIVVGTSHCDILMRSNNREWYPWLESKGYRDVEYDYSIEGRNRDILNEYWDSSIKQNRDFEVCYTLGMRGIHDWGSAMRAIDRDPDLSEQEKKRARVDMLSFIIRSQRRLLKENGVADSMQIFIPYKEVLDLYDNGLEVPEDVTLVWANDNFGYMRRFPSEAERARPGGNGIYYHVSYWAFPAMDYLFIGSTPLAHIRNELRKSWENGIRKLWVLNVGAIKPLEEEMEFFLRYAWEIDKCGTAGGEIRWDDAADRENNRGNTADRENNRDDAADRENDRRGTADSEICRDGAVDRDYSTDDPIRYLAKWIERNFSIADGTETAQILNDYAQLTNARKVEHMSYDLFSQNAYGDEGARRINQYADLYERANRIYRSLPEAERDAFFQLVLMKIHAAYYINCDYYFADRSRLCCQEGKYSAADHYTELSRRADYYKREMIEYYNKVMSGGKWDRILTPEEYKPPVTAMFPPRMPSLKQGENRLRVVLWDQEEQLCLDRYSVNPKWFELFNAGEEEIEFEIEAPEGIYVSESKGSFRREKRIFVSVDKSEFVSVPGSADESESENSDVSAAESVTGSVFGNTSLSTSMIASESASENESVGETLGERKDSEDRNTILVRNRQNGECVSIPVCCSDFAVPDDFEGYVEADGYVSIPADGYLCKDGWRIIPWLGRGGGNAAEADAACDVKKNSAEADAACDAKENAAEADVVCDPKENTVKTGIVCDLQETPAETVAVSDSQKNTEETCVASKSWNHGERKILYSFCLKNGGKFRAEIFRFPTLNSTGRIRAAVRVDDSDEILVESLSNDEWRGSWKKNVMSNVDRLTFELPALEPGGHTLAVTAIDAYFTFSAIVIYTKPQKDSYLAPRTSFYQGTGKSEAEQGTKSELILQMLTEKRMGKLDLQCSMEKGMGEPSTQALTEERMKEPFAQALAEKEMAEEILQAPAEAGNEKIEEQIPQFPEDFYGMTLPPRPTVYAGSKCWINNGLIDSNIRRPLEKYPVRNMEICSKIIQEQNGSIRIDAQSALAQDENAYIRGGYWTYADSETGLSMFVREKGLVWNDLTCAPSLNYRIQVAEGGTWHIWGLLKIDEEPAPIAFGLDGKPQPLSEQYNRGDLWCYEAKQIWRWTPVCDMEIPAGEHTFSVYAVRSGMRVDRIYLTKQEELPPDALEWGQ